MVNKNLYLMFSLAVITAVLLITFVSASIQVTDPAATANFSNVTAGNTQFTFNVIWTNGTDFQPAAYNNNVSTQLYNATSVNATFYLQNGSTNIIRLGNSSSCGRVNASTGYCNGTFALSITISMDATFNVTAELMNGTAFSGVTNAQTKNSTQNASNVRYDSSPPTGFNVTSVYNNQNYSDARNGTVLINLTFSDTGVGYADFVFFNITNSSGGQITNGSSPVTNATREGTTLQYSVRINTTNLADGKYNVTVFLNDTVGNRNDSLLFAFDIRIDNTDPSVTHSCSPTSVDVGDAITCSCSATDATTFVKSTTSSGTSPSTSTSGTKTNTCTAEDIVSNSITSSITLTVTESGLSSGTGSTTGGTGGTTATTWTNTYSYDSKELDEQPALTRSLGGKNRVKVLIESEVHHVGVKSVSATSAVIEVTSTPQEATLNIGDTKKFEVTNDTYYDLSVTLNSITNNKADITITSIKEEIPAPAPGQQTTTETGGAAGAGGSSVEGSSNWWIWVIVAVVVIVIIAFVVMKRKK